MAAKPIRKAEFLEVVYDEARWLTLKELRLTAASLMEALRRGGLDSIVYGSIARGDVTEKSDIDVFVYNAPSSTAVEVALESQGIRPLRRALVQATPTYAPKAYFEISEKVSVSMPLAKLRTVERQFYKFAGEATLEDIKANIRTLGVDKRLMLIEPTERGHLESSIIGREAYVASLLGLGVQTVLDRVRTLSKRDRVGRTGLFIQKEVPPGMTLEGLLKKLSASNPALRKRLSLDRSY